MAFLKRTEQNNKWWVLAAMTSCVAMTFLDQTVLPVTLPTIQRELNVSALGLQWLVNSYLLALTALVLAGGRLGDIFGHRFIFSIGLVLFACASAMCSLSYSEAWFVAARTLQGVGAAMLLPSTTAILVNSFPLKERGKALGLYVGIGSIFLMLGPFIGGLFTEYLSWRYVFWINLPIAAVGLSLALLSVPKSETKNESFDFLGFFTFSLGVCAIVIALMQRAEWGTTSPLTLGLISTGVLLIFSLWYFDRKIEHPFIDFSIFRDSLFSGSVFSVFFVQFLLMITVFWAIYFQDVLALTPLKAGSLSILTTCPVLLFAPLGGILLDRYGPRLPICMGFLLITIALGWFTFFLSSHDVAKLIPGLLILGCGVPLIFTPCFTTATSCVVPDKRGTASALSTVVRQFAATFGMAVIGSLFLNFQKNELADKFASTSLTANLSPSDFDGLLAKSPSALSLLNSLPEKTAATISELFMTAFQNATLHISLISAGISLAGFFFAFFMLDKPLVEPEMNKNSR